MNMTKKEILNKFGKNLKYIRMNKNKSQEELATEAHLHRTYIGMMERGLKNPTLFTLYKLSKALDVNVSTLLCYVNR